MRDYLNLYFKLEILNIYLHIFDQNYVFNKFTRKILIVILLYISNYFINNFIALPNSNNLLENSLILLST